MGQEETEFFCWPQLLTEILVWNLVKLLFLLQALAKTTGNVLILPSASTKAMKRSPNSSASVRWDFRWWVDAAYVSHPDLLFIDRVESVLKLDAFSLLLQT